MTGNSYRTSAGPHHYFCPNGGLVLVYLFNSSLCCTPHRDYTACFLPSRWNFPHLRENRTWGRLRGPFFFCLRHHHRVSPSGPSRPRSLHPFLYGSSSRVASRRPVQFCCDGGVCCIYNQPTNSLFDTPERSGFNPCRPQSVDMMTVICHVMTRRCLC
jgi:hypothetical protein